MFIFILSITTNNIHVYALAYWIYISVDVFGRKTATLIIYDSVKLACVSGKGSSKAIDAIYSYYIKNPFEFRGYITGSIFLVASLVGLWIENSTDNLIVAYRLVIIKILYIIAIGSIILNEIVIWCWRKKLYSFISEYDDNERIKSIIDRK